MMMMMMMVIKVSTLGNLGSAKTNKNTNRNKGGEALFNESACWTAFDQ
jgi:hypothetical protein